MRFAIYAILVSLLLIPACSGDKSIAPPLDRPASELDEVLLDAGKVVPASEEADLIIDEYEEEEEGYRYTYEVHDETDNIDSVLFLGLNDDVVWPGNLVKGELAYQFVYEPLTAARNPITLSVSMESTGVGEALYETIDDPKLSTVRQGISTLLGRAFASNPTLPARADFSYEEVHSQSQMNLFMEADLSFGPSDLSTAFDWSEESETHKVMAKYTQVYYTIDMDTPASPNDLFLASLSTEDLAEAMPAGSMPLYVASVSYGMMAMICMESSYSVSEMTMALDASYSGVVDVDLGFGRTARDVLEGSSLNMLVYGGSSAGLQPMTGFDDFWAIISASTDCSLDTPGLPLLYKFRHVADNTLALVSLTSQYTLVRPLQIKQYVDIRVNRFVCEMADDEGTDNAVDMDRFYVWANAFERVDENDPGTQFNPLNQQVFGWSIPGWFEMGDGHPAIFEVNAGISIVFDTEDHDFNMAKLNLSAYARDYDSTSANESATGNISLIGSDMWGDHDIMLYCEDFTFRCSVSVTPGN